jgi:hypothetical protein
MNGRSINPPNDRVQLPAALLGQDPSRGQGARPVNCNDWFGAPCAAS